MTSYVVRGLQRTVNERDVLSLFDFDHVKHLSFGPATQRASSKTAFTLPLRTARSRAAWSFSF